jgi:hypothetical protein
VQVKYTGEYCCGECRNNGPLDGMSGIRGGMGMGSMGMGRSSMMSGGGMMGGGGGGGGREQRRGWIGHPDARFGPGSERIGVGWRC